MLTIPTLGAGGKQNVFLSLKWNSSGALKYPGVFKAPRGFYPLSTLFSFLLHLRTLSLLSLKKQREVGTPKAELWHLEEMQVTDPD